MPDTLPKPDRDYVSELKEHLIGLWRNAHAKWAVADSYYNRTFALWPKELEHRQTFHSSRSTALVDHAVDQFMALTPLVRKLPRGEGQEHKDRADAVEPGLRMVFEEMMLRETTLTWRQLFKHILLYGYAIQEGPLWTEAMKPEEPEREDADDDEDFEIRKLEYEHERKIWLPLRARAVHPARVLLDPLERSPRESIKVSKMYGKDIEALALRMRKAGKDVSDWRTGKAYELYEVTEYYSKSWHFVMVDNDDLYVESNWTRIVPYKHAFSGWGQEKTDPGSSYGADPADLAVGMIEAVQEDLLMQAQQQAGRHNLLMEASFPIRGTNQSAEDVTSQLSRADVYEGQKGDIWWEDIPQLPNWLFRAEDMIDRDIETGTYARTLTGVRDTGVSTVGQQAILSTSAANKFKAPIAQVRYMAYHMASDTLRLIKIKGEKVTVRGRTIDPRDIEDYGVEVEFTMVDPVLALQEKQQAMEEVARGLLHKRGYWGGAGRVENPGEIEKGLLQDELDQMPEVKALMLEALAEEVGLFDIAARLDAMRKGTQNGVQPVNGALPGLSGILGPDGQPLASTLGTGGLEQAIGGPQSAVDQLRAAFQIPQGLTPGVPGQPRVRVPPGGING